jgi:mannose-6-phosphate isomerase-like protein (cupin superfamily)
VVAGGFCLAEAMKNRSKDAQIATRAVSVRHFDQAAEDKYAWGTIHWLSNKALDSGAEQTFGIVEIKAGHQNALHMHPNCEELLYVLSGSCEHVVGDKKVILHAGDLLRVPRGAKHQATVIGDEPLRAVISYSCPNRQVINYGKSAE